MKKPIKKASKVKTSYSKSSFSINWLVVALFIVLMAFGWYKYSANTPIIAEAGKGSSVLDNYQYNTQKVEVTKTSSGTKYNVVQQKVGDNTVGVNIKSDIEIAKNGAKLVEENTIKNAIKAGKTKEEAEKVGKVAAENSLHTSTAQIAAGIASQQARLNNASEEDRAAAAASAYSAMEKKLINTNLTDLMLNGTTNPRTTPVSGAGSSTTPSSGSTCGGNESNIGDKQWAMLGDGTNKCVQCGGPRNDGKGGPGVWGQEQVECGSGAATNYVAPIYQSDKPKACWKDGTWFADTTGKVGDEHCFNGKWLDRDQFIADKKKQCASLGSGYFYHEDHNACEKGSIPVPQCGFGFKQVGNDCVQDVVTGSLAGLERECEKTAGKVYNEKNGLCEASKVPLTKEQLIKAEIDHCKDLQKNTNKEGSTNWVYCNEEGTAAYQFCADGFKANGDTVCNLKPVNFGNSSGPLGDTQNPTVSTAIQTGVGSSVGCGVGFAISGPFGPVGCAIGTVVGGAVANAAGNVVGDIARGDRTEADDVARTAADDVAPRQNGPVSTFFQVGTGVVSGCVAGSMVGLLPGCLAGAVVGGYVGNTAGNALGSILNEGRDLPQVKNDGVKDESSTSAPTNVGILATPDAPGQFGYDSLGAGTGALTMLAATAGPCTVPIVIQVAGIPLSVACRIGAAAGGALFGNKAGDYIYSWTH